MNIRSSLVTALLAIASAGPLACHAQERVVVLNDVLNVDATVTSDVVPDLAVVTLAVVREGPDVAPLTKEVNETLAKSFAEAKAVPGVIASNGGYSTFPRYDSRGGQNTRTGWQVRAEMIVKSKDFNALGTLVGKLSQTMQIAGSSFEISPELRGQENATLIERAARAFAERAGAATKAFGYAGYSIRQVTLGNAGQSGNPRPMFMEANARAAQASAPPMPIESGRVTLSLTVSGSVQMRK
ncbi:MAG: SIMPL domain-containing protein [Burkholderiaceae bacterium]